MLIELAAHEANGSFEKAILPPGVHTLGMRWVFTVKYDDSATEATRKVARYKARLVIQGHTQVHGIDYEESYSPVISKEILRLMLTIGASLDYEIDAMDVITAFLNGEIDCEVYVKYPPGFDEAQHSRDVLRVRRSVYGLKQAPRLWFYTLVTYLLAQGFTQMIKDRCVFTKLVDGRPIFLGVYVDDLIIMAPSQTMIKSIKDDLKSRFKMHDLGELKFILGLHIVRDRSRRTLTMHQSQYASVVLQRFGMTSSNGVGTPMECNLKLSESMCPSTDDERTYMADKPYRAVVGSLMYLMISTRPDLAYVVQQLSQFADYPRAQTFWQSRQAGVTLPERNSRLRSCSGRRIRRCQPHQGVCRQRLCELRRHTSLFGRLCDVFLQLPHLLGRKEVEERLVLDHRGRTHGYMPSSSRMSLLEAIGERVWLSNHSCHS